MLCSALTLPRATLRRPVQSAKTFIGLFTTACYSRVNDHIWDIALLLALVGLVGAYFLYIGLPLKIGLCQTSHLHNYFAWNQFSIGIIQTLNGKYYRSAYLMSSFYAYCISLFVCCMHILLVIRQSFVTGRPQHNKQNYAAESSIIDISPSNTHPPHTHTCHDPGSSLLLLSMFSVLYYEGVRFYFIY